jgi:hypothetical protein
MKWSDRESGTNRLETALHAFRDALTCRTRETAPFGWAETQNNSGIVLMKWSERDGSVEKLGEAIVCFQRP